MSINRKEGNSAVSDREKAIELLDAIPDYKIQYVIAYLQGMTDGEEVPNPETLAAFREGDEMLANGTGKRYTNMTELFTDLEG